MNIPHPNYVFHIGNPCDELPHQSMERCEKFHVDHPEIKFIIVLWDQKDYDALKGKINKDKAEILFWENDSQVRNFLFDRISQMVGAQIVAPKWYSCTEQHVTKATEKEVLDKCPTCQNGLALVRPNLDKTAAFADLFSVVLKLINFDTISGEYLSKEVNPTVNVMRNMPYSIESEFHKPIEAKHLKGKGIGRKAIVCGAGPSLEAAIPELKRLSGKVDILCVGRAFRMLKAAGIKVDYTITVEMFDWDCAIFTGLTKEECGDTIMGFAAVCAPETVQAWPGKKVCLWDVSVGTLLKRDDYILGGNSVSHHMLNFSAEILQHDEIVMCGIDLAYPKPKTHADGTIPDKWPDQMKVKDAEYQQELWVDCTGKGTDFHPECHRMAVAMGGGGAFGAFRGGPISVRSSFAYQNFATLFSILIKKHGKKVWNACPNGQKIDGTEYLDLTTFLKE